MFHWRFTNENQQNLHLKVLKKQEKRNLFATKNEDYDMLTNEWQNLLLVIQWSRKIYNFMTRISLVTFKIIY